MLVKILFNVVILEGYLRLARGLSCQSDDGKPVAWWVLYKQPKGVSYAYIDATTTTEAGFRVKSSSDLNSQESAPGYTLRPLFEDKEKYSYLAYNDEAPDGRTDSYKAHAKGVFAINENGSNLLN